MFLLLLLKCKPWSWFGFVFSYSVRRMAGNKYRIGRNQFCADAVYVSYGPKQ
jgi:hypothetical protein